VRHTDGVSDPDPLLDRPVWAPRWLPSIDDAGQVRVLRWVLTAVLVAGVGACVVQGADRPADPELGDAPASELAARVGTVMAEIVTGTGQVLELCLLHADDPDQRSRGLKEVADLDGYDGMLFSNDGPVENQFVMIDTVMPLSISWWQADGAFLAMTDMVPCAEDDPDACTRYSAGGPYLHAIEVPQGDVSGAGIDDASRLQVGAEGCQPA